MFIYTDPGILPGFTRKKAPKSKKNDPMVATPSMANKIPPVLKQMYLAIQNRDVGSSSTSVYSVNDHRIEIASNVWEDIFKKVSAEDLQATPAKTVSRMSVPKSPCENDDIQLHVGRVSQKTGVVLGPCNRRDECVALSFRGCTKSLHPFLTPSQQIDFDNNGTPYEGECLLCIRKSATTISAMYAASCIGVDREKLPSHIPFYNLCNSPGGYKNETMLMPNECIMLPGPIAAYNAGLLQFVATETTEEGVVKGYFDQQMMIWRNDTVASN
jgi:hypothetical protein